MKNISLPVAVLLSALLGIPLLTSAFASTFQTADPSCMQQAIHLRDERLAALFSAYSQSIGGALAVRSNAEVAAWSLTDTLKRQNTIQAAENTFSHAYNAANMQLASAKDQLNRLYIQATQSCFSRTWQSGTSGQRSSGTAMAACTQAECGPMPGMPNSLCPDGTMAGPSACMRKSDGTCGYTIHQCSSISSSGECTQFSCPFFLPVGCYRTAPTMVNGCKKDCGVLVCSSSSAN